MELYFIGIIYLQGKSIVIVDIFQPVHNMRWKQLKNMGPLKVRICL